MEARSRFPITQRQLVVAVDTTSAHGARFLSCAQANGLLHAQSDKDRILRCIQDRLTASVLEGRADEVKQMLGLLEYLKTAEHGL